MTNELKQITFEKLARKYYDLKRTARWNKQNGHEELGEQARHQAEGIELAVEALGYSLYEFGEYYIGRRREYRKEVNA